MESGCHKRIISGSISSVLLLKMEEEETETQECRLVYASMSYKNISKVWDFFCAF